MVQMIRWRGAIVAAALAASLPAGLAAQSIPSALEIRFQNRLLTETLLPESRFARESGVDHQTLREYFHRSAAGLPVGGYLTAGPERIYGIERIELSRVAVALEGAELGASIALFAAALGTTFSGWDEESSWYFVGAAAAAGALWGGAVRADEPKWRVRYRWDPE